MSAGKQREEEALQERMAGMSTYDLIKLQGSLAKRMDAIVDESVIVTVSKKLEVRVFTNGSKRHALS